jgi:hypothetical protein
MEYPDMRNNPMTNTNITISANLCCVNMFYHPPFFII